MTAVERRSTTSAAVAVGAVTAASRVLGFVRVLVVAGILGASYLGNAFQAANSFSNVLFELIAAGALSAVLVPTFVALLDAGRHDEAEDVAGGILGVALAVLGLVTVVGVVAAPVLARLLTIGVPASVAGDQRELVAFLLRFFVPQIVLYAAGTIAIAVLQAKRRFLAAAAAPIGNTVVMVVSLAVFRALAGDDPGLDLSVGQKLWLVVAGTGGVVAFVTPLLVACRLAGFRLRPRFRRRDERVNEALRHAGWGIVLHSGAGVLLGAAIVAGAAVEGGVVAYQVGWVFFLAPYAILAQPVQTTIYPELAREIARPAAFAASVRWALERISLFVVPVTGAMVVLAVPAMQAAVFGEANEASVGLLAAALAALAVGLLPYSAFLLLARGFYVLGDSRTPGLVSIGSAVAGVLVMSAGAAVTSGAARVAMLGFGHTSAYLIGAAILGVRLQRAVGASLVPKALVRTIATSAVVAAAVWLAMRAVLPAEPSRVEVVLVLGVAGVVGAAVIALLYRVLGVQAALTRRDPPTVAA